MELFQEKFDIQKWIDSEKAKKDLCSTYDICKNCDKSFDRPCEKAYLASKKIKRRVLSFKEKLDMAKNETKVRFDEIVAALDENGVKCRICKSYTSIKYKNKLIGKFTLTRSSLKCHLPIEPNMYPDVTHLDYSDKKTYVDFPFTIKVNTKKAMKNIITLTNIIIKTANN